LLNEFDAVVPFLPKQLPLAHNSDHSSFQIHQEWQTMLNRLNEALLVVGHFISGLLALAIVALAWGVLAVLSLLAGLSLGTATLMLTNNAIVAVFAILMVLA
jgi:hypothetical protein